MIIVFKGSPGLDVDFVETRDPKMHDIHRVHMRTLIKQVKELSFQLYFNKSWLTFLDFSDCCDGVSM